MSNGHSWIVHNEGNQSSIAIAVDFPMAGRGEASFADFASLIGASCPVWETSPAEQPLSGPVSGAQYVDTWLRDLRASGRRVRAIFSFCAGAAFVGALQQGIGTWQDETPKIIMFDPELPVPLTLHVQFRRVLERFAPFLSEQELQAASDDAQRAYRDHPDDIAALQQAIHRLYHEVGAVCIERAGLDARHGAELLAAFDSFARYLVAGAQVHDAVASVGGGDQQSIAISSNSPTNGLNLVPEEQRAGLVGKEIQFDVQHAALLASPEVARTVVELLG